MNQPVLKDTYQTTPCQPSSPSLLDLVQEMKSLDVDPMPFMEMAARDIIMRHGAEGVSYAKLLLEKEMQDNNADGIYLWQAIYSILSCHNLEGSQIVH